MGAVDEVMNRFNYEWLAGALVVFFAFIGFDAVSTTAEECRNPGRDLPRGILGSLVICTVIYAAVALVVTGMLHYTKLGGIADPLAYIFTEHKMGAIAGVISFGAVIATTAALLVYQSSLEMAQHDPGSFRPLPHPSGNVDVVGLGRAVAIAEVHPHLLFPVCENGGWERLPGTDAGTKRRKRYGPIDKLQHAMVKGGDTEEDRGLVLNDGVDHRLSRSRWRQQDRRGAEVHGKNQTISQSVDEEQLARREDEVIFSHPQNVPRKALEHVGQLAVSMGDPFGVARGPRSVEEERRVLRPNRTRFQHFRPGSQFLLEYVVIQKQLVSQEVRFRPDRIEILHGDEHLRHSRPQYVARG